MKFEKIAKRGYVADPTPLQELKHFRKELGGPQIWIKRDDLLPFGGNKVRKMDYLFEEALQAGADTVITASTNQCCHNGILLMLANREGMQSKIIMETWGDPSYEFSSAPEYELYRLAGNPEVHVTSEFPSGPVSEMPLALEIAHRVQEEGGKPWFISRGGEGPLGACGYVGAAFELVKQWKGQIPDVLVCPCGLGGTQAGLIVGLRMLGCPTKVVGIGVTGKSKAVMEQSVAAQCLALTTFLDIAPISDEWVCCVEGCAGEGYAKPFAGQYQSMRMLAQTEGILTDPVYSGKTLFGLTELIRRGVLDGAERVVFLHTGGMSLYYDYHTLRPLLQEG
ncbi:MAG TPA: pyridoxal-phosphate dependent enzyme [Candidatus Agathobaculum merdavium]|nr:pyridoxal-phosphate dependent enzyme [Candidatus Agathobaculum merdavium]